MYKIIYPQKDSSIFEYSPEQNTGIDPVLELKKIEYNQVPTVDDYSAVWKDNSVSRILMKFDIDTISSSYASGELSGSLTTHLKLWSVESRNTNYEYEVEAYPLTQAWENGNGNVNDVPIRKNGVSWKYTDNNSIKTLWDSGSSGHEYNNVSGGGSWNSNYKASQSFHMESADISIDISNIMNAWIDGTIPNHGLILKYSGQYESGSAILGNIKFFGRETHTIFVPRIITYDEGETYSGSFNNTSLVNEDMILRLSGLRNDFQNGETIRLNIFARDKYLTKTHTTSATYRTSKRLPETTYYKIVDTETGIDIVNFNDGTKIQTDNNGHYIEVDINNFQPKRFYEIIFKVVRNGRTSFYRNKFFFKVER